MDGFVTAADSMLPFALVLIALAGGVLAFRAMVSGDGVMPLVVSGAALLSGGLYYAAFVGPDERAAWVAYRDAHCEKFDQKVVAGSDGQTVIGAAATSKGLTPAVGFVAGTADRVVTGWQCANGRSYAESDGKVPSSFDPSQI